MEAKDYMEILLHRRRCRGVRDQINLGPNLYNYVNITVTIYVYSR